jgi:hypothetical protein
MPEQGRQPFNRSEEDERAFRGIVERVAAQLGVTSTTSLADALNQNFQSIAFSLNLESAVPAIDPESESTNFLEFVNSPNFSFASADDFQPLQVEHMLEQAAILLERCLVERAEWNELREKAFELLLEIMEFIEIDTIHQDEIAAGFYTVAFEQSRAEAEGNLRVAEGLVRAAAEVERLRQGQLSADEIERQTNNAGVLARVNTLELFDDHRGMGPLGHPNILDPRSLTKSELAEIFAARIAGHSLEVQRQQLLFQEHSNEGQRLASEDRQSGLDAKREWDRRNIDFSRRRTEVARQLADLKSKAATDIGGPLNFVERMGFLEKRFERDFREAFARIQAASAGLRTVYDYNVRVPGMPDDNFLKDGFVDDCILWVQNANSFVSRFTQLEQSYVQPVSLRRLLNNDSEWTRIMGTPAPSLEVSLPLIEDDGATGNLFPSQRHVRLRGVSGFVEVAGPAGVWQLSIVFPEEARAFYLSNRNEPISQRELPTCRLSRVSTRESVREPDVTGMVSLHNVSPFGTWRVFLSGSSTAGVPSSAVQDIIVDLHVAVRQAS